MRRASRIRNGLVVVCGLLLVGCNSEPSPTARFTPAPEAAHQALEAALRSWQQGRPPGKIEGLANPTVILVDNCRRTEQKLDQFTILGETTGEGARCFAVRLRLQNPEETQRLRFVVFGVDPLWVYRYEDYEMMIHWQCGAQEKAEKSSPSFTPSSPVERTKGEKSSRE